MNVQFRVLVVALGVASAAGLASSLSITQYVHAQTTIQSTQQTTTNRHWCDDQRESSDWRFGCQNGWWDHDHCQQYRPETGEFAKGYVVGWNKGHCK